MLIICRLARIVICALFIIFSVRITAAAECGQDNFGSWLEQFKQEALGLGICQESAASALNGITYDAVIIARDHSQSVFQQSFEQFSGRMVSSDRLRKGASMLKRRSKTGMVCQGKCWWLSGDWKAITG